MKQGVYILFLLTGFFCLYMVVTFLHSSLTSPDAVIDFSRDGQETSIKKVASQTVLASASDSDRFDQLEKKIQRFEKIIEGQAIPIGKGLVERLSPYYTLEVSESKDIFGFYIFGELPVSVYSIGLARIYAFEDPYYIIKKNLFVLETSYDFNETNTFFDASFFLNAKEDDGIVRLVFEFENQTYGVEVLRSEYESLKKAVLSR